MSIPIKYNLESPPIEGQSPIIVIGPNGSGKTRYGLQLTDWNNAENIAALRNIALAQSVPVQSMKRAETELRNQKENRKRSPWNISSEINHLFAKLMAEDAHAAVEFRDNYRDGNLPRQTKLMILQDVWQKLFPGRHIDFKGYTPQVMSEYVESEKSYSAQSMSDGERVALYLAGRVLDAPSGLIVVDEPEVHFHSRLAIRFWDELERIRSDCRFIYITHDLTFALSRVTNDYIIIRPGQEPQLVSMELGISEEITQDILSAASFSIFARIVIFCEGTESSLDQKFLHAWYKSREHAIIPVGSCRDVIKCTTAFRETSLVNGLTAIGIVDKDYWPDAFVASCPEGVSMLPFHEIESLLCDKGVAIAIAKHLGKSKQEAEDLYENFLVEAANRFSGELLNYQISERFKRRCEGQINSAMNALRVEEDEAHLRTNHCEALSPQNWNISPEVIFDEESVRIKNALHSPYDGFLELLPGKVYINILVKSLGLNKTSYIELIERALREEEVETLQDLGNEIRDSLNERMPSS